MPRLGYMIVDGLALVLVAVGLAAVVVGYERNLPDPAKQPAAQIEQSAERASDWMDPVTTGSIAPRVGDTATGEAEAEAAPPSRAAAGSRVWMDPPGR